MSLSVSSATPHELIPALRVLFGARPDPERDRRVMQCHAALAVGDYDPAGLFVARDSAGRLCGAALAQTMPGSLALAWPPRGESREIEDAITAALCDWLRGRGVKACQAFAAAAETGDMAPLERAGFRHVTQIVFMRREVDEERDRLPAGDRLDGAFYQPAFRERVASALLATQDDTRDCPELDQHRTREERIASANLPDSVSTRLFLATEDGAVVGLWQAEPGDAEVLTLAYLGVVPAARGHGLGAKLCRQFLNHAAGERFRAIELSVDARNEPALRLYRRHGFTETERREVWLAAFPASEKLATDEHG